jgi:hypothetical protein
VKLRTTPAIVAVVPKSIELWPEVSSTPAGDCTEMSGASAPAPVNTYTAQAAVKLVATDTGTAAIFLKSTNQNGAS